MANSLLPPNATALERAIETATTLDIPTPIEPIWSVDDCPAAILPWLAWTLSVDEWNATWSETRKRAVIRASIAVHRRKGTIGALRRALAALGIEGLRVAEWFETAGDPYTFSLSATPTEGLSREDWARLLRTVAAAKNVRSHLAGVTLRGSVAGPIRLAVGVRSGAAVRLLPPVVTRIAVAGPIHVATATHTWARVSLKPPRVTRVEAAGSVHVAARLHTWARVSIPAGA